MIEEITPVDKDCEIANAHLVCDSEYIISFYEDVMFTIYLDSHDTIDYNDYPSNEYSIIIHDEAVYISIFGITTLQTGLE